MVVATWNPYIANLAPAVHTEVISPTYGDIFRLSFTPPLSECAFKPCMEIAIFHRITPTVLIALTLGVSKANTAIYLYHKMNIHAVYSDDILVLMLPFYCIIQTNPCRCSFTYGEEQGLWLWFKIYTGLPHKSTQCYAFKSKGCLTY
jgi:hypothetical protein